MLSSSEILRETSTMCGHAGVCNDSSDIAPEPPPLFYVYGKYRATYFRRVPSCWQASPLCPHHECKY